MRLQLNLSLLVLVFDKYLQLGASNKIRLLTSSDGLQTAIYPPQNRFFIDPKNGCQLGNGIAHMLMYSFQIDFAHSDFVAD